MTIMLIRCCRYPQNMIAAAAIISFAAATIIATIYAVAITPPFIFRVIRRQLTVIIITLRYDIVAMIRYDTLPLLTMPLFAADAITLH